MKVMETGRKTGLSRLFSPRWSTESHTGTVVVLVVMIILQTLVLGFDYDSVGHWFSAWGRNWINILRNNAAIGIIALGMTFVIITGGIDLAVGSTLVAIGAASMMMIDIGPKGFLGNLGVTGPFAYAITIICAILMGLILGALTGLLITKGRIAPFVATLGTMKILRSVTQHFMQGYNPRVPRDFLQISNLQVGGLMFMPIIYWLAIAAVLIYVSQRTVFGRQVIAVGSNERAAQLSGVNVDRVKVGAYALTGILVAIASIIQVARIGTMDFANAGQRLRDGCYRGGGSGRHQHAGRQGYHYRYGAGHADYRGDEQPPQPLWGTALLTGSGEGSSSLSRRCCSRGKQNV
jgi:ribose transport system permease protein